MVENYIINISVFEEQPENLTNGRPNAKDILALRKCRSWVTVETDKRRDIQTPDKSSLVIPGFRLLAKGVHLSRKAKLVEKAPAKDSKGRSGRPQPAGLINNPEPSINASVQPSHVSKKVKLTEKAPAKGRGGRPQSASLIENPEPSVNASMRLSDSFKLEGRQTIELFIPLGGLRGSIAIIFGQPSQQRGDDTSVALDQTPARRQRAHRYVETEGHRNTVLRRAAFFHNVLPTIIKESRTIKSRVPDKALGSPDVVGALEKLQSGTEVGGEDDWEELSDSEMQDKGNHEHEQHEDEQSRANEPETGQACTCETQLSTKGFLLPGCYSAYPKTPGRTGG